MEKKILSLSMSNESARATTSHSLSLYEQRFLWFAISEFQYMYKYTKNKSNEINIPINNFYKTFNLIQSNTYQILKKIAKKISLIQLQLVNKKKQEFEFYTIFPKFVYKNGYINLEINNSITKHFLNLEKNYFLAKLSTLAKFKYKYSWFFYSYFKTKIFNKNKGYIVLSIEKIKKELFLNELNSYNEFGNIKKKVLLPAITEINEKTNLEIIFNEIKKLNKVISLKFTIINNGK